MHGRRDRLLALLRITRRIFAFIFAADMRGARFVCRLLLTLFVSHDPLCRGAYLLRLWHAGLAAVFAAHILLAF